MSRSRKCCFGLLTGLLLLTSLELAARAVRYVRDGGGSPTAASPKHVADQPTTTDDPVLHHAWIPNLEVVDDHRSIPYTLTTNAQAWVESYDVALAKPAGTFRIMYVGDSNTQGVVAPRHKMVEIVERRLNDLYTASNIKFEVINTGTSSYSPLLYYLLIKTKLLQYAPDLVVINVDMTDVVNDYVYRKTVVRDESGEILAVRPSSAVDRHRYIMTPQGLVELPALTRCYRRLKELSAFCYYADKIIARARMWTGYEPPPPGKSDEVANWLAREWTPGIEQNVEKSMAVLSKTIRLLKRRQVGVVLAGVPHYPQYAGEWSSAPHEALERTAEKEQVPYLNAYAALASRIRGTEVGKYYWTEDRTHFNIAGNRIWAEAQIEFLLDPLNDLLPQPGQGKSLSSAQFDNRSGLAR